MSEYTAEDFAQSNAERKRQRLVDHIADQDRVIRRRNEEIAGLRRDLADAQAPLSLGRLEAAWEAAEQVEHLSRENKAFRVARDELRKIVDELHAEIRGLRSAPITLDGLAAAWEAAEVSDECNAGDVLIVRDALDVFTVWVIPARQRMDADTRILSRAPREPWQDLADVLADMGNMSPTWYAKELYERGVRMAGGDDDA